MPGSGKVEEISVVRRGVEALGYKLQLTGTRQLFDGARQNSWYNN